MKKSIIRKLQESAMDSSINIDKLVINVYVLAKKLNDKKISSFLKNEMNGYINYDNTPEYRKVYGCVKYVTPFGWKQLIINDSVIADILCSRKLTDPLASLVEIHNTNDNELLIKLSSNQNRELSKVAGFTSEFYFVFINSQISEILNTIRLRIIDWTIDLDKEGVAGDSFVEEIKDTEIPTTNITNNFNQQIIQASTITQDFQINMDMNQIAQFIKQLKEHKIQLNISNNNMNLLNDKIEAVSKQLEDSSPNKLVIREALSSVRSILEGLSGSVIATGLISLLTQIMG